MAMLAVGSISAMSMSGPASASETQVQIVAPAITQHASQSSTAVTNTADQVSAMSMARLKLSAVSRPITVHLPIIYRVKSGQSLAKIAGIEYNNSKAWPVIYWANKNTIKYADIIYVGQELKIPAMPRVIPAPPENLAPPAPKVIVMAASVTPHTASQPTQAPHSSGGYSVSSSFQACVIRAESGGDPDIWNASGHWGLYQFSAETWAAHGGDPALFGNADSAYQTEIFWNTVRDDGTSDWAPYDGC
jgi:hypothetical protein